MMLMLAAAAMAAQAHADHSTMGIHGMALFGGKEGVFASHLPLFAPPHERQILLELTIDDRATLNLVTTALGREPKLWTFEPEEFELARLLPNAATPLKSFTATITDGHFERGGQVAFPNVRFRVKRVIINRPLVDKAPPATVTYDLVGRALVKRLEGRPDYDHIVALKPGTAPATVTVSRVENPVAMEKALARSAPVRTTIYFETGDLR